ncbi:MAG: SDR family oxidoreductase [Alphaproteobacteria bacterium]|nr:SDR family oxidoreductase [Alphaproteobacteria bacterium]
MPDLEPTQRVIITAGGSGIGEAIAESFLSKGSKVHICDINEKTLKRCLEKHEGLRGSVTDIGNPEDVENLVRESLDWMGGVDVLINNAGVGGPNSNLEDISYMDWDRTISVNLNGMFYCIKNIAKTMKDQKSGCIINISTASAKVALPGRSPYVASKVGVLGLTHTVAREYGPFGIRCNAILPGLINNERGRGILSNHAKVKNIDFEEAENNFLKYISLRTWIDPSEVGELAVFLASSAGRHITGQQIGMDGNVEWEI